MKWSKAKGKPRPPGLTDYPTQLSPVPTHDIPGAVRWELFFELNQLRKRRREPSFASPDDVPAALWPASCALCFKGVWDGGQSLFIYAKVRSRKDPDRKAQRLIRVATICDDCRAVALQNDAMKLELAKNSR